MKSEVKELAIERQKYPYLGKFMTGGGFVVLFSSPKTGTVVSENLIWKIGTHARDWAEEDAFPLHGTVTLFSD